jgi:predicted GIY-YIG superfamily endonuclease
MQTQGIVYLYHFDTPFRHARHYLGWTVDLEARDRRHRSGKGARLLARLLREGIGFRIVRTWPGVDKAFERQLKRRRCTPRLCPVCRANRKGADDGGGGEA